MAEVRAIGVLIAGGKVRGTTAGAGSLSAIEIAGMNARDAAEESFVGKSFVRV